MTQTFSKTRLIDYFAVFDLDIESLFDKNDVLTISNFMEYEPIIPKCSYRLVNFFPKKLYKDCYDKIFDSFNHIINNLTDSFPNEELYVSKQENKFFCLLHTESGGKYYYGHYLRVYEEYKNDHLIYKILPKELKGKKIYGPKYLCFVSWNPFFISFKSILEEIYSHSKENKIEQVKVENILNFLLFRVLLPKYEDTQISFAINKEIFKFNSNIFYSEISLKILFQLISIENIVKIVFAYLTNSWIIFLHSNIEIISPIISAILSLILPFPPSYNIIINFKEKIVDVLECPLYPIVGIYKQDFQNIDGILKKKFMNNKINKNSYMICDLDKREISYFNIDINFSQTKEFEDKLIRKLKEYSNIYDSTIEIKKIDVWKEFQSLSMNRDAEKSEILSRHPTKVKGTISSNITKRFDELKIRAVILDFIASLFEAFDENKHYKNENNNKIFDCEAFINDSKENLKEFLKVITSTPLWDIFIQNITHIVNTKYIDSLKSNLISDGIFDIQKNSYNKTAAILDRCDRVYELFVKAIEKKKLKKSLKSLFKINITHNISLPQIPVEHNFYSQTGIFNNPLNEIKFTNFSSISLHKNQLNIPFATLQENPNYNDILNFISKESLSNYLIITSKNLSEEYCKYYRKYNDYFIKFFGFSNKLENIKNNSNTQKEEIMSSRSVKLQKAIDIKDNYVNIIHKMVGACKSNNKIIAEEEIISTNKNYKNEFNINIGINIVQTVSLCEYCKYPNSLWEIRKNIRKIEKKYKIVCINCKKFPVAQFIVIEETNDDDPLFLKGNNENDSFITEKSILDIRNELRDKKEKEFNNLKKIEYMSMEQIYDAINALKITINEVIDKESDIDKNTKSKKEKDNKVFPTNKHVRRYNPTLYYNLLLLFGDIKIISDINGENVENFNIEEYVQYLEKKNSSYVNKWEKSNVEKSKSKNKDKKSVTNPRGMKSKKKEPEQKKKVFKCELRNFMTKHNHDKFIEENMKKLAQLNNSLNRTELNSIGTDYRQTINKTNDNINETFQTKRSEGFISMNSFNQLKRINTGKDKFLKSGTMKFGVEDDFRDSLGPGFNIGNPIENMVSNFKMQSSQTKKNYDNESQMNTIMRTKTVDLSRKESKPIIQNSNYKDLFFKKHFQNFK